MRYSPNGQHIVMERWEPRRIEICEAATGSVFATFSAGQNPRWQSDRELIAESPDGLPRTEGDPSGTWLLRYLPANRGQIDANGHREWAVADTASISTQVYQSDGSLLVYTDAREPRLSGNGTLAARRQTGAIRIGIGPDLGLCEDSRWSSETLVWWLGGRVWGRSSPEAPTVELTVPGRACAHPCPYWSGEQLYVGLVLDEGDLWVATWADLVARNGLGWRVGASSGSSFDWAISHVVG